MTAYHDFVSKMMKSRPSGVAPKDYMKTIAQKWHAQKGGKEPESEPEQEGGVIYRPVRRRRKTAIPRKDMMAPVFSREEESDDITDKSKKMFELRTRRYHNKSPRVIMPGTP